MSMRTKTWVSAAAGLVIANFAGAGSIGLGDRPVATIRRKHSPRIRTASGAISGTRRRARERGGRMPPRSLNRRKRSGPLMLCTSRISTMPIPRPWSNAVHRRRRSRRGGWLSVSGPRIDRRDGWPKRLPRAQAPGWRSRSNAIRVLGPDAAKEEGRSKVTPAKGGTASRTCGTLRCWSSRTGNWLFRACVKSMTRWSARTTGSKVLGWMVGDWIDEGPDSVVRVNCRWSEDGNFLIRRSR